MHRKACKRSCVNHTASAAEHSGARKSRTPSSDTNEERNIVGQQPGHFADDVSAEDVDEGAALRCAQQNPFGTNGGGEVGDGVCGGVADRVAGDDGLAETLVAE